MAKLWLVTRFLGVWPARFNIPTVWPALLAASLLAWTQALTWMPYPLPGLRVIVTVLWLVVIDTIIMVALNLKAPEPVMLAILAPHIPLAYLVPRFAVARPGGGAVDDWIADRRQDEGQDLEHAGRLATGRRHHSARVETLGHGAAGDRKGASAGRSLWDAARDRDRAAGAPGTDGVDLEAAGAE